MMCLLFRCRIFIVTFLVMVKTRVRNVRREGVDVDVGRGRAVGHLGGVMLWGWSRELDQVVDISASCDVRRWCQ